ncbi:MAG: hypothetical protein ACLQU1_05720 [Bryobacteraceae bacterium]
MTRVPYQVNSTFFRFAVTFLAAAGLALAQDQAPPSPPQSPAPPSGGWRRAGDLPPAPASAPAGQPQTQDPSQPTDRTDAYGQAVPPVTAEPQDPQQIPQQDAPPAPPMAPQTAPQSGPPQMNNRPAYGLPADVTLQPGTYVTARINQPLSSDRNLVGDTFSATLIQPVVVNGIVVAQRGQTVYGRVSEAQKAHSDKPSRLGLELTGMTLADGTQVPVKSQLVNRQGGSTPGGVQAGTVVGTTAVGAAIGGAAAWGTGAAIGAGAGMMVGVAGVLLTRNHPTIIYPETVLMFQVTAPVTIATGRAPQAFHYVGPNEYGPGPGVQMQMAQPRPPVQPGYPAYPGYSSYYGAYGAYGAYPYYPGYPYPYYYPYYPYYWGGVGVYFGGPRGFIGGRGFGGFRR